MQNDKNGSDTASGAVSVPSIQYCFAASGTVTFTELYVHSMMNILSNRTNLDRDEQHIPGTVSPRPRKHR